MKCLKGKHHSAASSVCKAVMTGEIKKPEDVQMLVFISSNLHAAGDLSDYGQRSGVKSAERGFY